jgi:hypothetical protein
MDEGEFDVKEEVLIECFHDAGSLEERLERLRSQRKFHTKYRWALAAIIVLGMYLDLNGVTSALLSGNTLTLLIMVGLYSHCRSIIALHRIQALRLIQDQRAAQ